MPNDKILAWGVFVVTDNHFVELIKLADLFIDLESSLEKYYDHCAKIFPDEKFAWFGISTQEGIHAKIFKKIKEQITERPERWALGKYNHEALKMVVDSVHARLAEIESGSYNSKYVVTFVRDVEASLVESDIAKAFISDGAEYRNLMNKILEETIEHKEFMVKFLSLRGE